MYIQADIWYHLTDPALWHTFPGNLLGVFTVCRGISLETLSFVPVRLIPLDTNTYTLSLGYLLPLKDLRICFNIPRRSECPMTQFSRPLPLCGLWSSGKRKELFSEAIGCLYMLRTFVVHHRDTFLGITALEDN